MTDHDSLESQFDALLELLADDALTDENQQQLNTLLREHPELRSRYLEASYVQAALILRGMEMPPTLTPREKRHRAKPEGYFARRGKRTMAAVALLSCIATSLALLAFWPHAEPHHVVDRTEDSDPASVARIEQTVDAVWATVRPNVGLHVGQRLNIESGLVEIRFRSGARAVVEGPAELSIVDRNAARLDAGRLVAHIDENSRGFRVDTPIGSAIDRGTQMGLFVRPASNASPNTQASGGRKPPVDERSGQPSHIPPPETEVELCVFEGEVEWQSEQTPAPKESPAPKQTPAPQLPAAGAPPRPAPEPLPVSRVLKTNESIVVDAMGPGEIKSAPTHDYIRELPGPSELLLSEDFESYSVGQVPQAADRFAVHYARLEAGRVQQIVVRRCEEAHRALQGERCLEFEDTLGYRHHPNPILTAQFPAVAADRPLIVQFDFRRHDSAAPILHVPQKNLTVRLGADMELLIPDTQKLPGAIAPEVWHRARLVVPPPSAGRAIVRLDLWRLAGAEWQFAGQISGPLAESLAKKGSNNQVTWGFDSARERPEGGRFAVDQIHIQTLTPASSR